MRQRFLASPTIFFLAQGAFRKLTIAVEKVVETPDGTSKESMGIHDLTPHRDHEDPTSHLPTRHTTVSTSAAASAKPPDPSSRLGWSMNNNGTYRYQTGSCSPGLSVENKMGQNETATRRAKGIFMQRCRVWAK
jgi:hypothetical protein